MFKGFAYLLLLFVLVFESHQSCWAQQFVARSNNVRLAALGGSLDEGVFAIVEMNVPFSDSYLRTELQIADPNEGSFIQFLLVTDPIQNHRPIPHGGDKAKPLREHPLVVKGGVDLKNDQPLVPLDGHVGGHTDDYYGTVKDRLDGAEDLADTNGDGTISEEEAQDAVKKVIDGIIKDILSGDLDPYTPDGPNVTPVPKPDGTQYSPGDDYPLIPPKGGPLKPKYGENPTIPLPEPVGGSTGSME